MNEMIAVVAILAAELGAIASTIQGYWNAPPEQKYSTKKLLSALLSSGFTAFGLVNLSALSSTDPSNFTWVGLILGNLILGFGIDKVHSVLDK